MSSLQYIILYTQQLVVSVGSQASLVQQSTEFFFTNFNILKNFKTRGHWSRILNLLSTDRAYLSHFQTAYRWLKKSAACRRLRIQVVYVNFCGIFFILPSYYVTYCRCFGIFLA